MTMGHNHNDGQLKAIVERIERIKSEIDYLNGDLSEIYKEAKSLGYDIAVLKQVIAERRKQAKDENKYEAQLSLFDLYYNAVKG